MRTGLVRGSFLADVALRSTCFLLALAQSTRLKRAAASSQPDQEGRVSDRQLLTSGDILGHAALRQR